MFDRRLGGEWGGAGGAAASIGARPDDAGPPTGGEVGGARQDGATTLALLEELVTRASALVGPLEGSGSWSVGQRAAALRTLDRLAGVLAAARAGVVVAEQAAAGSTAVGDRDFVAARARASRAGLGAARREVAQARALSALPVVAGAVVAGRVPVAHLDALAKATTHAGQRASAALATPVEQERLVRLAERLSVREFGGAVQRLVASFDPGSVERGLVAQKRSRFLVLSRQADGVHLRGRLDVLAGVALRTALDGIGIAPDQTRDKAQADADALIALVERATTGMAGVRPRRSGRAAGRGSRAGAGAGVLEGAGVREGVQVDVEQDAADARVSGVANRPVVSILIPAETFLELQTARQRGALDPNEDEPADRAPLAPATLEDGTPIALSQVAQALCDCQLGRIVLDADSIPLDLGRTTRLYSAAQRRAVILRDRACAWNGCEVPAAYSQIHHIRWWDRDDGPSDYDNAVLLCSHHHHVVHQHDLTITRLPRDDGNGDPPGDTHASRPEHDRHGGFPDEPTRYAFHDRRGAIVGAPATAQGDGRLTSAGAA